MIDTSTKELFLLRQDFNISDNGKRLHSLKHPRRKYSTFIINTTYEINDRETKIDDLLKKRDMISNDVNMIRKYKNSSRSIMKDHRYNHNKTDHQLIKNSRRNTETSISNKYENRTNLGNKTITTKSIYTSTSKERILENNHSTNSIFKIIRINTSMNLNYNNKEIHNQPIIHHTPTTVIMIIF